MTKRKNLGLHHSMAPKAGKNGTEHHSNVEHAGGRLTTGTRNFNNYNEDGDS